MGMCGCIGSVGCFFAVATFVASSVAVIVSVSKLRKNLSLKVTADTADFYAETSFGACCRKQLNPYCRIAMAECRDNLFICFTATVGTGIGAGIAFSLSMLLINAGMKHILRNRFIPELFRGTPALFIYVSLIALAMSCISGQSLFV